MQAVALLPSLALVAGAVVGIDWGDGYEAGWLPLACVLSAVVAWGVGWRRVAFAATLAGFTAAGLHLGAAATERALRTPLRAVLDAEFGGFLIDRIGAVGSHAPVPARLRLQEDAAVSAGEVLLRGVVETVRIRGHQTPARGGVVVTVAGRAAGTRAASWRAGRGVEAPMTFRRPTSRRSSTRPIPPMSIAARTLHR